MSRFFRALAPCLVLILFGLGAGSAGAQPLSLYKDEAQARLHCAGDAVVWLDFHTRRYYTAGQPRYGRGRHAVFTCRSQARRSGYRRSIFGRR
jgi:hypothetical protein